MLDKLEKILIKIVKLFYNTYKIEQLDKYDENMKVIDSIIVVHSRFLYFNLIEWYSDKNPKEKDIKSFSLHTVWKKNETNSN